MVADEKRAGGPCSPRGVRPGGMTEAGFVFHGAECARLTAELEQARDASTLRDTPTLKSRAELNELLLRLRGVAR